MIRKKIILCVAAALSTLLLALLLIPGSALALLNLGINRYGLQLQHLDGLTIAYNRLQLAAATIIVADSPTQLTLVDAALTFSWSPFSLLTLSAAELELTDHYRELAAADEVDSIMSEPLSVRVITEQLWALAVAELVIGQLRIVRRGQQTIAVSKVQFDRLEAYSWALAFDHQGSGVRGQLQQLDGAALQLSLELFPSLPTQLSPKALLKSTPPLRIVAQLQPQLGVYEAVISAELPVPAVQQLLQGMDLIPATLGRWHGAGNLQLSTWVADDLNAWFTGANTVHINRLHLDISNDQYSLGPGHKTDVPWLVTLEQPLALEVNAAGGIRPLAGSAGLSLKVNTEDGALAARVGLGAWQCALLAQFRCQASWTAAASLNQGTLATLQFSDWQLQLGGSLELDRGGLSIEVDAGGSVRVEVAEVSGMTLGPAKLDLRAPVLVDYQYANGAMHLQSSEAQLRLPKLHYNGTPLASVATLSALQLVSSTSLEFNLGLKIEPLDDHRGWPVPLVLDAVIAGTDEKIAVTGAIDSDLEIPLLAINANHMFSSGFGDAQLQWAAPALAAGRPLSNWFNDWPRDWDIHAGVISASLAGSWQLSEDNFTLQLDANATWAQLAGVYRQAVFTGADGAYALRSVDLAALQTQSPACINVELLDIGVQLTNLSSCLTLDGEAGVVSLEQLTFSLLGGAVALEPVRYNLAGGSQQATLVFSALSIDEILALTSYPDLQASGLLNGRLPLQLGDHGVAMEQGTLVAQAPGGTIRYRPGGQPAQADNNPALQLVNDALANYQFDTLQATAQYSLEGDLDLAVAMRGANPDLNNGQKIHLNLNASNNIPQLIASLQSSRTITELLQQHLQND